MLDSRALDIILRAKDQTGGAMDSVTGRIGKLLKAGLSLYALRKVGDAVGDMVQSFASFDDAMNQSISIMGDVSDSMREQMATAAREVGKTTRASAQDAAESYYFLASAGLSAEQSLAAMPQVAQFAQAGAFDLATATDILTDAQSALGMKSDDAAQNLANMTRVSDVLVKAATLANASVEQFGQSLVGQAGPAMKAVGMDVEEGAAVLAAFADQGIKAEEASTKLNRVLLDLQSKAITNRKVFDKYGVTVYDANGELASMADIIGDLEDAFVGLSDEERTAAMQQMGFTDRSSSSMLALLGNSDALREYEAQLRIAGGTTQEVSDKQLSSFAAKWDILKGNLQEAGFQLAESLMPHIEKFAEWVTNHSDDIAAGFKKIGEMVGWVAGIAEDAYDLLTGFASVYNEIADSSTKQADAINARILAGETGVAADIEILKQTAGRTDIKAQARAAGLQAGAIAQAQQRLGQEVTGKGDMAYLKDLESQIRDQAVSAANTYMLTLIQETNTGFTRIAPEMQNALELAWRSGQTDLEAAMHDFWQTTTFVEGGSLDAAALDIVEQLTGKMAADFGTQESEMLAAVTGLLTTDPDSAARETAMNYIEDLQAQIAAGGPLIVRIKTVGDLGVGGSGEVEGYARGTAYVPSTGLALIHKGETIFDPTNTQGALAILRKTPLWPVITGGVASGAALAAASGGGGVIDMRLEVPVMLDGRELTRGVARTLVHNGQGGQA